MAAILLRTSHSESRHAALLRSLITCQQHTIGASMTTDLLPHIADHQFDASVFNTTCHSISIGPATATFCASLAPPSVSVKLSVLGHEVANCQLSNLHPTCTIGGSFHGAKAELDLTLDLPGKKLNYKLTVCLPFLGCKSISGSIPL
jgi:hypothetical protein